MRLQLVVWAAVCLGADLWFQLGMQTRTSLKDLRRTPAAPVAVPVLPAAPQVAPKGCLSPIVLEVRRSRPSPATVLELFPQFRIRQRINVASAAALSAIPGFSDRAAEELVKFRKAYGPYGHRAELLDVMWIGWTTYLRLLDFITLDRVAAVGGDESDP